MKDRFDLEEEIVSLHNFCEYLDDVYVQILEDGVDVDDLAANINAVSVLLRRNVDKLLDTMAQTLHLDQYSDNSYT
jgi:hypothetical protein